jgi:hypothetical protein
MNNVTILPVKNKTNITAEKNKALRNFYYETSNEFCLIYNHDQQISILPDARVYEMADMYFNAYKATNIPYFTGYLKKGQIIDYKDSQINVSTAFGQNIYFEAISRKAITAAGFFDTRLLDNTSSIDYALRLGDKGIYPKTKERTSPWFFDIVTDKLAIRPVELEKFSSNWLAYKYPKLPWTETISNIDQLKTELKRLKTNE